MRPIMWRPPVEPSPAEQAVIKAVRRAKLFVFLRQHRHELFDEQFQAELAETYAVSPKGQPPVPPARLALATILQAYAKVSDDEVIEATVMDRRWQLVLDCMGAEEPPFPREPGRVPQAADRAGPGPEADRADGGAGGADERVRARRCGRRWTPPRCGGGPGGGHRELDGTRPAQGPGHDRGRAGAGQAAGTAVVAGLAGVPQLAASSLKAALDADSMIRQAGSGAGPGARPAGPGGRVHRQPVR